MEAIAVDHFQTLFFTRTPSRGAQRHLLGAWAQPASSKRLRTDHEGYGLRGSDDSDTSAVSVHVPTRGIRDLAASLTPQPRTGPRPRERQGMPTGRDFPRWVGLLSLGGASQCSGEDAPRLRRFCGREYVRWVATSPWAERRSVGGALLRVLACARRVGLRSVGGATAVGGAYRYGPSCKGGTPPCGRGVARWTEPLTGSLLPELPGS